MEKSAVVSVAFGCAAAVFLLTTVSFLLLRRYEAVKAARKEAERAPILREKRSRPGIWRIPTDWVQEFRETTLHLDGVRDVATQVFLDQHGPQEIGFSSNFSDCTWSENPTDRHDLAEASHKYFGRQLDLGVPYDILHKMLVDPGCRSWIWRFLMYRTILMFTRFPTAEFPESLLPPEIVRLAKELKKTGPAELSTVIRLLSNAEPENPFDVLFARWRVMTCKMYGDKHPTTPEEEDLMSRIVDFLHPFLLPYISHRYAQDSRQNLLGAVRQARKSAIQMFGRMSTMRFDWDVVGPQMKITYCGPPSKGPPFDMVKEKTLVIFPSVVVESAETHGKTFDQAVVLEPAQLGTFTDKQWARYTST